MRLFVFSILLFVISCEKTTSKTIEKVIPEPDYTLKRNQTHSKFSKTIEPVLRVKSGAVIKAETEEATDQQLNVNSTVDDLKNVSFDPIHPLTGPVYVEEAEPGDILAVTLHKFEVGDWGWTGIFPGFGFLADEFLNAQLKTYKIDNTKKWTEFKKGIRIPLNPFAGVLAVAPDTEEMLSTIPPRANGGNMDDPNMTEGTTVYLPVQVKGALFSIGDTHAAQGLGEVCGSALEAPMTITYELNVIKTGKKIKEPQYETDEYYAVTGFGKTIDEASKKATRYMIDYLVSDHGLTRDEAYMLCSLAGDLKIAEVVDVPNMLVTMHIPKEVLGVTKNRFE